MADAAAAGEPEKKKLTKKEKERAEKELRKSLPPLQQVSRNGVFEMAGPLGFTWAAGNVPGGPFVPVNVVCRGHNLYVFDGGEAGQRPSAKPRTFFQVKRAEVTAIRLLVIPPLPPHTNVFKLEFAKKQFGHRAFFFKCASKKDMDRWLADLRWRVFASDADIRTRNEPKRGDHVELRRVDETETAIDKAPERILGMSLRYVEPPEQIGELEEF